MVAGAPTQARRTSREGKKLTWRRDGWRCLAILVMIRLRRPGALPAATTDNVRVVVPMPAAPAFGHRPNGQIANAALCGTHRRGAIMCRRQGVAGETEVTA